MVNVQALRNTVATAQYDVVIVGAGPYGLSTAAHLLKKGLNVAVFGKPLNLWREYMPQGMLLRSYWWATNLSDPEKKYDMARYFASQGQTAPEPLSRETFIAYSEWFQKHAVPDIDETYVKIIEQLQGRFKLTLEDGRVIVSRAVVMAPGLRYYFYSPDDYAHLSSEVSSHTAVHDSFDRFAGKHVVVLGGGQSALESAALLNESGAKVTVVSRSPIHWLHEVPVEGRTFIQRIRFPKAGIAPGWFNWGLENMPSMFQRLPRAMKDRLLLGRGRYGPAGSPWLKPRLLGKVTLLEEVVVKEAKEEAHGVVLTLSNGTTLHADHFMLGTGYKVNIWNLPMVDPVLLSKIRTYRNTPVLSNTFESNIPGLYFVGISSVSSCGPLYRFVVGAESTARRVAGAITQRIAVS